MDQADEEGLGLIRAQLEETMRRPLSIAGIFLVTALSFVSSVACKEGDTGLEVKYRYLVVEVVGPSDWAKKHDFSIRWKDKDVKPPVVFRVPGTAGNFEMGSGGEMLGHLIIGDDKAPVTAKPTTKFQVRNTGAIGLIREKSSNKDTVAFSIATSVALSPPQQPGVLAPNAKTAERDRTSKTLQQRVSDLIAAGRVIEVSPPK